MDVFTCECGKQYRRRCDLSKHQRYHCRGAAQVDESGNTCTICSRDFNTFIGLRQHQRLAHPIEYNAEVESSDNRTYANWSALEDYELAAEELAYEGININQHLATIFEHRSVESIKSHRRSKTYKDLVERIRSEREEAVEVPPVPVRPPGRLIRTRRQHLETVREVTTVSFEHLPAEDVLQDESESLQEHEVISPQRTLTSDLSANSPSYSPAISREASPPVTIRSSPDSLVDSNASLPLDPLAQSFVDTPLDNVKVYLQQILSEPDFPRDLLEPVSKCLSDREDGSGALQQLFDRIVTIAAPKQLGRTDTRSKAGVYRKKYRGNAKRAYLYKKAQKLYHSNRSYLANSIFEGTLEKEVDSYPEVTTVEETFRDILETPSISDHEHISSYVEHNTIIYRPILCSEIKGILNKKMSEAAGVDLLTPSDLKKVSISLLACLFNLMMFVGDIPIELKRCRTTLIPKGDSDLLDVNNWRPITVTSVLLRIFNKILACRFKDLPFHCSQRGFLEIDGTLANTMTLQAILKSCRRNNKPHCITTLDLRKAFDSVSHSSIERALKRFRIDERVTKLIMNTYRGTTTNIRCGPNTTGEISMRRGVKQGDPLSPLLFNLVMDELLTDLHKLTPGITVDGSSLTVLAYADDLVLFTENSTAAQLLVRKCERFLGKRQMELNANKCTILTAKLLPNKKKLYISTRSTLYANGGIIPAISVGDQFKYLGYKFSFTGTEKPNSSKLHEHLRKVCKSPLKPFQKLNIINFYLLPRYMYILQAPNISLNTLSACDKSIRYSVKKILHLPQSTTNSFLYAPLRTGGLGITCFATKIPGILQRRIRNLQGTPSGDGLSEILCGSYVVERLAIFDRMLRDVGLARTSENQFWSYKLEVSVCGNGISSVGNFSGCSSWVYNPPPFWSGRDYVNAILTRGNLLPVRGGVHNEAHNRSCRAGCNRTESLSHVLQKCPATHFERINRHDRIVKAIADAARSKNWEVLIEPRLRDATNALRKPDLVMVNEERIIVSDVGVHWEGPEPLQLAAMDKVRHYNDRNLETTLLEKFPNRTLHHLPFILGARGGWWLGNNDLCNTLQLNETTKRSIIYDLLKGGWSIHRAFSTKIWERRTPAPGVPGR